MDKNNYFCETCNIEVPDQDVISPVMTGFTSVRLHITCKEPVKRIKQEPIREPCDWWFHSGPTTDEHGNQIPKGPFYCANKKSTQYLSRVCPRQTCEDHANKR